MWLHRGNKYLSLSYTHSFLAHSPVSSRYRKNHLILFQTFVGYLIVKYTFAIHSRIQLIWVLLSVRVSISCSSRNSSALCIDTCSLELVRVPLCLSESAQFSGAREKEGGVWSDEKTGNKQKTVARRESLHPFNNFWYGKQPVAHVVL